MAMYRHKPIEIEAVQFRRDVLPWPKGIVKSSHSERWALNTGGYFGTQCTVYEGDWVVSHPNVNEGDVERYVCKRGVFEATYELVEGEHNANDSHDRDG